MEETRVTEANDEQQQQQHLVESGRKESEEKEKEKGTKGEEQSEESHKKQEAKSSEDQEQKEQVPPRKEYQQQPPPPPPSKKEEQRSAAPPKPQAAAANNGGGWGWGSLWSASSALVNDYILPLVGDTDEEQAEKREETEATNDAVKHQEEEEEEEQDRAVELGKAAYSYVESMASAASSSLSAALSDKAVLERGREVGEWSTTMSFEFLERMGKATFDVLSKELAAAAAGISPQEDQANTTTSQRTDFTSPSLSHQNAASSDRSSFEACFEEKHGSIHLQALENLSTQCVVRLGQADGDLLAQLQESFQSIKDVLAQEEEDDDDDDDDDDEDEDEEEHEDESVGKDKRQVKDAKKASASPLPVNGLNRRARLKKKMIESFVKEAKNKVEELASFYEGELQEAVEEMKGKEDSAVTEHIMKTALEGFDKVCYQSMLILSELSANGIELLLRVAESYLVLEDTPARKEEPLERANFITALTTYLLKEVSELATAYTRCLSAIKDCAGKANAASSADLAKVLTKESLRIHAYAGSASTNLECKSLFVSICQASLLLREEEQRKGQ